MKGVRSLCIICSLDFTNGVNEEEENKLPLLFAKIWKVFCHHFNVSTSSSSKSKYDEIFNYFFSISELPFCNNCRNDAAELLILHEKCQKIQEKMREVKSRISVTIVNSSKSTKFMPNANKDAQNHIRLKAGTENLTVNEDANDSSKNHNDPSIFDEVLCNEQVNELIHHMRLQIVENYNPQIVLLDVNGQSRDNNEKTKNHKISNERFQKDVHNEYDVDRHDNSSPLSTLNEESPLSPVLLNSYDDEKDEEEEIHNALSNNLFGSLINCRSLNEIKVESGSTNVDNLSTPNPSVNEETTIDEEPSYASSPHQLEEGDFQNVNIITNEGEKTQSKLPLLTTPALNPHFQIDHIMEEDDEEEEEEEEQECDPLALDLKPDPGQLPSRIKEEPAQEYHDNYAPLSPHQVTFEATVQVPKSASQPKHNSASSSNNAHDPETPDLSTSFRQSVAMTQSVSRSILPPSTPSGIPLRYIAKAAIKSNSTNNNNNNNSKSVSLGYVLVPAKMVASSVSGSAAAAVASSSSLSSSSSVKDLVKIKRGGSEKNDCVKTYAPAKSSKGQGQGQIRDPPIKITRKRPVVQVKSKVKSVSRDKEQMRRSGERQNLENLAKLLPRFKYLNNPKEGQFLPSKISILQKAKQYIEELGKLERNLANQEKKAKTQNNNLKIQIALLSAKNVKTLSIVKSNHLTN